MLIKYHCAGPGFEMSADTPATAMERGLNRKSSECVIKSCSG
jgi:hypothetical protein